MQGDRFFRLGPVSEVVSLFVKGPAKATCRPEVPKSSHRVVSLLDAPIVSMVLLQPIVQLFIRPMNHFAAQYPTNGPRVRVVPVGVGSHPRWLMANYIFIFGSLEEPLGTGHIPVLTQHRVDQVAIAINRTIEVAPFAIHLEVAPFAIHLEVSFIDIPGAPSFSSSPGA